MCMYNGIHYPVQSSIHCLAVLIYSCQTINYAHYFVLAHNTGVLNGGFANTLVLLLVTENWMGILIVQSIT